MVRLLPFFNRVYLLAGLLFLLALNSYTQVTADFKILQEDFCDRSRIRFVNLSTKGAGINNYWKYGNTPYILNNNDTTVQLFEAGTHTIWLKVTDGGFTDSTSREFTIFKGPTASFTINYPESCAPVNIEYTNTSIAGDANIINSLWDLRFGVTSNETNLNYTYTEPGNYDVLLKVKDENGCFSSLELIGAVKVYKQPYVDFSMDKSYSCVTPVEVSFTDKSTFSSDLKYSWNFGNGETSEFANPKATFANAQNYEIRLEISDTDIGCQGSATKHFPVQSNNASFIVKDLDGNIVGNNQRICPGELQLINTTSGGGDFLWEIENKKFNTDTVIYNFTSVGKNIVMLTSGVGSGCEVTAEQTIYVDEVKAEFSIDSKIACEFPQTIHFTNQSVNSVSNIWKLAFGKYSYATNASVTIENSEQVEQTQEPGNEEMLVTTLYVLNPNGCKSSVSHPLEISIPFAEFKAENIEGCAPLEVSFTDVSKSSNKIVKWELIIPGDTILNVDMSSTVKRTFNKPGDFLVQLVVTDTKGCADTSEAVLIKVGQALNPNFSLSPGIVCAGDEVRFTDLTVSALPIDYWHYTSSANLGSDLCEDNPNPKLSIHPKDAGFHDVRLYVSQNGCISDSIIKDALYVRGPIASFNEQMNCSVPLSRKFISTSQLASSLKWEFNHVTDVYTTDTLDYVFPSSNDYIVSLISANDTSGCVDTIQSEIKIRQISADLQVKENICAGVYDTLDASLSKDYVDYCYEEGFYFDFGDSTCPVRTFLTDVKHRYQERGTYTAMLIANDVNGCVDTATRNINVFKPDPIYVTDTSSGCAPELTVQFQDISLDTNIAKTQWVLGDGINVYDSVLFSHTYKSDKERIFTATLFVTDVYGCHGHYSNTIKLFKPQSDFLASSTGICVNDEVSFSFVYNNYDSLYWFVNDTLTAVNTDVLQFNDRGFYNIGLRMVAGYCENSETKNTYIKVEDAFAAFAAYDTVSECYPEYVEFKHLFSPDPIVDGQWDFDFNNYKSQVYEDSVEFNYTEPGNYNPTLWVRTVNGCIDTSTVAIKILGPTARFEMSDSIICRGDSVQFNLIKIEGASEFEWIFGDGDKSNDSASVHQYDLMGEITPQLYIADSNGCKPPVPTKPVLVQQVKAGFNTQRDSIACLYEPLVFTSDWQGATKWYWFVDSVSVSFDSLPENIVFTKTGQYLLTQMIQNDNLCGDTIQKLIAVYSLPEVSISSPDVYCEGLDPVKLFANYDTINTIFWQPDYAISSIDVSTPEVNPDNDTAYVAQVTDVRGCVNADTTNILVKNVPQITRWPVGDTTILLGQELDLQVYSTNPSIITWDSILGDTSCLNCFVKKVMPLQNQVYIAHLDDACFTNEIPFYVNIYEIFSIDVPQTFTPNGDGINDKIMVMGGGIKELTAFKIYNRWGNLLFSTNNLDETWDGYFRGKLQPQDTYTYYVEAIMLNNETFRKTGNFQLVY